MQFAEARTSTSAQNPTVFNFNNSDLRVFDRNGNPWFAAADIATIFNIANIRKRLDSLDEDERCSLKLQRGGTLTIVSESGMWTLVLRSDAALEKGTPAYKARKWVTKEVLPAIRKTGQYSATEESSEVVPLTPRQQYKIQRAVAERAKGSHVHFNTIYKAIKIYFKVAKYDQIPASRFDECINFIQTVDLRIPEVLSDQPVEFPKPQLPSCPHCELVAQGNIQQASVKEIQQLTIYARNALTEMEKERIRAWTCLHEIVFKLKAFV